MDEVATFTRIVPATETMFMVPVLFPLAGAIVDLWFTTAQYYDSTAGGSGQAETTYLNCVRASTAYAQTAAGTLTSFAPNVLRITDLGLLTEASRNNIVLWSQDLTNVVWTKTNVTAALNQTGPDGVANSASLITATAGNGTVLQSITFGSDTRYQSAWVKRITGSGTINMTMDNGATWTVITVTSGWTLAEIPSQTLANPTVGFRIVTNGDAIAVDFVQNENGTFATSPIPTTTVLLTRASDLINCTSTLDTVYSSLPQSDVVDIKTLAAPSGGDRIIASNGGLGQALIYTSGNTDVRIFNGANELVATVGGSFTFTGGVKIGSAQAIAARAVVGGGGTVAADINAGLAPLSTVFIGSTESGSLHTYAYIRRLTAWNSKLADATLQGFTA